MPVTEDELIVHQKNIGGKRVTKELLEANIKSEDFYIHPGSQLTICILTLQNGYTVTGESACADPKMFNEDIGKRLAKDRAVNQIWPLMGYNLKQEMYLSTGNSNGDFRERVRAEERALSDNITKLDAFINQGTEQFDRLPLKEQNLLREQLANMVDYQTTLQRRIAGF